MDSTPEHPYAKKVAKLFSMKNEIAQLFDRRLAFEVGFMFDSKKNAKQYIEQLESWKFPTDLAYQYLAYLYNLYTDNPNSLATQQHVQELLTLLENSEKLAPYIHNTVIDIWCGNGKKWVMFVNELAEQQHKKFNYVWLDFSHSMLNSARNNYDYFWNKELVTANFQNIDLFSTEAREKLLTEQWNRTFFVLWWTPCNFRSEDLKEFLDNIDSIMKTGDTLIINFYTFGNHKTVGNKKLTLRELQQKFLEAETIHYQDYEFAEVEKQKKVDDIKRIAPSIDITADDLQLSFFLDEKTNLLIDRTTIVNDIYHQGEILFTRWTRFDSTWTLLDEDFFEQIDDSTYPWLINDIYNSNQSREFVLELLKKRKCNPSKRSYRVEQMADNPWVKIRIDALDDDTLRIGDESVDIEGGTSFFVTQSKRYKDNEAQQVLLKDRNRSIIESMPVMLEHQYLDVAYETMRSYVIQKK